VGIFQTSTDETGNGIECNITTDGSGNPTFVIEDGGWGYAADDEITFTDPGSTSNTAVLVVDTVTAARGTNAYVFDAETGGWSKVSDMVDGTKNTTNMVNARGDKLLIGGGANISYVNHLADRTAAAAGYSLKTKILDLGNPENKKNLLEVAVVYNGYGNAASAVNVITTADDGSVTTTDLGDLDVTDGEITTKEFDTSATAALQGQKTFQIVLTGTFDHRFEAYSITLTHRDIGNH